MWRKYFFIISLFSLTTCWIHDVKVIGFDLVQKSVLPVNYFFVQLLDIYGRNYTSPSEHELNLLTFTFSDNCKRISQEKIYTGDGLFIYRFKVFEESHHVELGIRFNDRDIIESPFCISQLTPEQCRCPRNVEKVMNALNCPAFNKQIHNDLLPFTNVDFKSIKSQIQQRFRNFKSSSLCNYVVKSNVVYRKCYGQYTGFSMFMDTMMTSITNKVFLPDVEFFINLGDWPLIKKSTSNIPIFSWCGSKDTLDIVLPTYDLTESTLNMFHRVVLDILSVQKEQWKWSEKIDKAFFRGRDSRRERLDIIDIGRKHPHLLNSSISNFFFFMDEIEKYGPKVGHISFFDFFEHKYQINIDGTVAAYRLPYLLAANSVVLKQDSPYYEHFYRDLLPFEHFIPFHRDPKLDLVEKINWLKENDEKAEEIMKNARNFVRGNLMPANIFCYYLLLLNNLSERISSPIEVDEDMEEIESKSTECSCSPDH